MFTFDSTQSHPLHSTLSLSLSIFLFFSADKAIQEMNAKAKKVIAAYGKAIKHAHKPDSRIRLMFVGDSAAGEGDYTYIATVPYCVCVYCV